MECGPSWNIHTEKKELGELDECQDKESCTRLKRAVFASFSRLTLLLLPPLLTLLVLSPTWSVPLTIWCTHVHASSRSYTTQTDKCSRHSLESLNRYTHTWRCRGFRVRLVLIRARVDHSPDQGNGHGWGFHLCYREPTVLKLFFDETVRQWWSVLSSSKILHFRSTLRHFISVPTGTSTRRMPSKTLSKRSRSRPLSLWETGGEEGIETFLKDLERSRILIWMKDLHPFLTSSFLCVGPYFEALSFVKPDVLEDLTFLAQSSSLYISLDSNSNADTQMPSKPNLDPRSWSLPRGQFSLSKFTFPPFFFWNCEILSLPTRLFCYWYNPST